MTDQPLVCCVCLTKDRPEMLRRAVASFKAQTYENKRLLIVNSGPCPVVEETDQIWEPCFVGIDALTVGEIRNVGNRYASHHYAESSTRPEIFCHWDDDDLSHPNRIAEQVALLQASGADCVGYSDMLFWRERRIGRDPSGASFGCPICLTMPCICDAQAWLYLGPQKALGTSLCYWRRTWEAKPFPDQPRPGFATGEDTTWIKGLNLATASSLVMQSARESLEWPGLILAPRMIASIHGSNTSGSYKLMDGSDSWRRVAEWDDYCRKAMAI